MSHSDDALFCRADTSAAVSEVSNTDRWWPNTLPCVQFDTGNCDSLPCFVHHISNELGTDRFDLASRVHAVDEAFGALSLSVLREDSRIGRLLMWLTLAACVAVIAKLCYEFAFPLARALARLVVVVAWTVGVYSYIAATSMWTLTILVVVGWWVGLIDNVITLYTGYAIPVYFTFLTIGVTTFWSFVNRLAFQVSLRAYDLATRTDVELSDLVRRLRVTKGGQEVLIPGNRPSLERTFHPHTLAFATRSESGSYVVFGEGSVIKMPPSVWSLWPKADTFMLTAAHVGVQLEKLVASGASVYVVGKNGRFVPFSPRVYICSPQLDMVLLEYSNIKGLSAAVGSTAARVSIAPISSSGELCFAHFYAGATTARGVGRVSQLAYHVEHDISTVDGNSGTTLYNLVGHAIAQHQAGFNNNGNPVNSGQPLALLFAAMMAQKVAPKSALFVGEFEDKVLVAESRMRDAAARAQESLDFVVEDPTPKSAKKRVRVQQVDWRAVARLREQASQQQTEQDRIDALPVDLDKDYAGVDPTTAWSVQAEKYDENRRKRVSRRQEVFELGALEGLHQADQNMVAVFREAWRPNSELSVVSSMLEIDGARPIGISPVVIASDSPPKPTPQFPSFVLTEIPGIDRYRRPPRGSNAELRSLSAHISKLRGIQEQTAALGGRIYPRDAVVELFIKRSAPFAYMGFDPHAAVLAYTLNMNNSANPGANYYLSASTNAQLFSEYGGSVASYIEQLTDYAVKLTYAGVRAMSRQELFDSPLGAVVRLMIKDQAHSPAKQEQELWRLIAVLPAHYQVILGHFYHQISVADQVAFESGETRNGVLLGVGADDRHLAMLDAVFKRQFNKKCFSSDLSSMDWTEDNVVHEQLMRVNVRRLRSAGCGDRDIEIFTVFAYAASRMGVMTSSGHAYFLDDTIRWSGGPNTSLDNSQWRVLMSYEAELLCNEWFVSQFNPAIKFQSVEEVVGAVAHGDDATEPMGPAKPEESDDDHARRCIDNRVYVYSRLGSVLKPTGVSGRTLQLIGFDYDIAKRKFVVAPSVNSTWSLIYSAENTKDGLIFMAQLHGFRQAMRLYANQQFVTAVVDYVRSLRPDESDKLQVLMPKSKKNGNHQEGLINTLGKIAQRAGPVGDAVIPGLGRALSIGGAIAQAIDPQESRAVSGMASRGNAAGSAAARSPARTDRVSHASGNVGTGNRKIKTGTASTVLNTPMKKELLATIYNPQVALGNGSGLLISSELSPTTSEWARNIAGNFESWSYNELRFEFVPSVNAFAAGTLSMAVQPDPARPPPSSLAQMMAIQGATCESVRLGQTMAPLLLNLDTFGGRRFTNSLVFQGQVAGAGEGRLSIQDDAIARQVSAGSFLLWAEGIDTEGDNDGVLGELWITYSYKFYTPILNSPAEAAAFTVFRATGDFTAGMFNPETLEAYGTLRMLVLAIPPSSGNPNFLGTRYGCALVFAQTGEYLVDFVANFTTQQTSFDQWRISTESEGVDIATYSDSSDSLLPPAGVIIPNVTYTYGFTNATRVVFKVKVTDSDPSTAIVNVECGVTGGTSPLTDASEGTYCRVRAIAYPFIEFDDEVDDSVPDGP